MARDQSWLPIREENIAEHKKLVNGWLTSLEWSVARSSGETSSTPTFQRTTLGRTQKENVSFMATGRGLSRDELILDPLVNRTLGVIQRGTMIGLTVSDMYSEASGFDVLADQNKRGQLPGPQQAEYREKVTTAAAIAMFVAAYYIVYELSQLEVTAEDDMQKINMHVDEMSFATRSQALQCMLFYLGKKLNSQAHVTNESDYVRVTLAYARAVLNELIAVRVGALKFAEPFTDRSYKLENEDFHINGFTVDVPGSEISVEFNRVEFGQIVGNKDAKHAARRLAERMAAYCPVVQKNPFIELAGGMATIRMGYGRPGTGKSLQIAATATLLHDLAEMIGIPFLFAPMPDNLISTFQGGSAERAIAWWRLFRDPSRLVYGPIDDGENNLEERTRQGVSAGVREVVGVFLRETEGASAVAFKRGNVAIDIMTNIPDQIDAAVLSRIVSRFAIDGPETREDFYDQDRLWWTKFTGVGDDFVDLSCPDDYEFLAAQRALKSMADIGDDVSAPHDERLLEIFERVRKDHDPFQDHDFYAHLFVAVQSQFEAFRGRDVRNIQSAVGDRIMDFDLEPDWLTNPDVFYRQEYDVKLGMLRELMHANARGLSFAEIRLQETVRYLDNMVRLAEVTRSNRIKEMARDIGDREAAAQLFQGYKEGTQSIY